jgi:nucleotide-binding universal stress UspA family protein
MATRILVPLDGSRLAEQAIPCAIRLGQALAAELVLLHAVSTPPDSQKDLEGLGSAARARVDDLVTSADAYLQSVVSTLRDTNPNVGYVIKRGSAAKAIVDYATETGIQHIVMATHGYSGLEGWTKHSVTEHVVRAASVPVLLVCSRKLRSIDTLEPISFRRVLVPLDGSGKAEQILTPITTTAQALKCEMFLFQVPTVFLFESASQAAERMAMNYLTRVASDLEDQRLKVSVAIGTGLVAESIAQFAKTNHIDLIAMSTHGHTGIVRRVLGSVAGEVLRAGDIPVLMVRARQKRNGRPMH